MEKKNEGFVHLHVHTDYSLLDSLAGIDELLAAVEKQGAQACAITDTANMFGVIEFYEKAKKRNIKPIIGVEIHLAAFGHNSYGGSLILLAKNMEGYQNLMKIVSAGHIERIGKNPPVIGKDILEKYSVGLIALSGGLEGEIGKLLLEERDEDAWGIVLELSRIFGKDNFYLELQDTQIDQQDELNKLNITVSHHLDIPLVITDPVHYIHKKDEKAYDVLRNGLNGGKPGSYLKTEEELRSKFSYVLEGMTNALKIAEKCDVELDLNRIHPPEFVTGNGQDKTTFFMELVNAGIKKRYDCPTPEILRRMEHEIAVIKNLELVDCFLIIWDFLKYAEEKGIPAGPGRGLSPGSIVNYALGITDIDPIKYGLIFELFINPVLGSMPFIDTDFCYERRGEVMGYVIQKYSKDNVSKTITFARTGIRGALREAGKATGTKKELVDKVIKLLPYEDWYGCKWDIDLNPKLNRLYEKDKSAKQFMDIASRFERHYSHARVNLAGIVISDKPLKDRMPLYKTDSGEIISGFTLNSLEKIGMFKVDFLGLKTLTFIDQIVKMVKQRKGIEVDINAIPPDDKLTYKLFSDGDTDGVFQMESARMRGLLKKLKPQRIEDIAGLLALDRPSTIKNGLLKDFVGRKKNVFEHVLLDAILEDSGGLLIYKEQMLRILSDLAGFSMAEANDMRRKLCQTHAGLELFSRNSEKAKTLKKRYLQGCLEKDLREKDALEVLNLIQCTGPYAFSKAHVISYAMISYRAAYLKANYPEEFEEIRKQTGQQKMALKLWE